MADYIINAKGSTSCNYPSTVNANDVLTFNVTNTSTTTKYQGYMLTYTFPCDCTAEILAAGAKGGNGAGSGTGGRGAIVAGTISFKMGDQLLICVGQAGTNNTQTSSVDDDGTTGAGGGGTYVVRKVNSSSYRYTGSGTGNNWYVEPLVIAAGGNGGGDNIYSGNTTVHGSSNQGTETTINDYCVGGGFSTCAGSSYAADSGRSFLTGAKGATNTYYRNDYGSVAGFGGGGGNTDDGTYGGGGGGYSGGDADKPAYSFVMTTASNISRKSGAYQGNNGEGYVKITFKTVVPPHDFPEDQVVTTTGFNAKVKTNDSWKDGTKGYVKVNNTWKEINKMYTKVNNQWILTGEEKKYTVKSLIDEGFVNPNTQLGEYNGTATYSAYTAGAGIQLYVASSSYPTAIGNFKTNTNALKDLKSITFDFTRTSGNTNFNIGIFVSSTTQSGRLNSTNTNNLIKAYKTFNAASGSVTIDLEEAFGSNLNTYINSNYYIGFYLNCSAATTVVIKNATLYYNNIEENEPSNPGGGTTPPSGNTSSPIIYNYGTDNYGITNNNNWIKGASNFGITEGETWFEPTFTSGYDYNGVFVYNVFKVPIDVTNYASLTINFVLKENMWSAADLEFALLGTASTSGTIKVSESSPTYMSSSDIITVTLDTTGLSGNLYFAIGGQRSIDIVIYKISLSGGGTTTPAKDPVYLIQNGTVNNNTVYGTMATEMNTVILNRKPEYNTNVSGVGFEYGDGVGCAYTNFGNKVDLSDIKEIQVKLYPYSSYDSTNVDKFALVSMTSKQVGGDDTLPNGITILGETTLNYRNNNEMTLTIPVTNSNISGTSYLGLAYFNNSGGYIWRIVVREVKVIYKDGTSSGGGSTGGTTGGGTALVFNQGFWSDSNITYAEGYVTTNKIDVKSVSSSQNITFNIIDSMARDVSVYIEAWYNNGTYISYILNEELVTFVDNSSAITITKNDLAYELNCNSNDIGYIALSLFYGGYSLYPNQFTGTVNFGSSSSGGGSTNGLTLKQGYYNSTGDFISDATGESIATDKISVKSVSNSVNCMFAVTCTSSMTCTLYLEVWGSDGTSGTYINYSEIGNISFVRNQPQDIGFTKDILAASLDLASGYGIGHVALSIFANYGTITPNMFTVTFDTTSSGAMPIDDI